MTESKNAESSVVPTNFDNLVLKQWLYSVGPVHRCDVLRKLKKDLQNLGYSRKQVYHGLMQLATKPRVILTRVTTPHRKYGLIRSLDKDEKMSDRSCTRNVAPVHSGHGYAKIPTRNTRERIMEEEDKQRQKWDALNTRITASIESTQGSLPSRGDSILKDHKSGMFLSFEKFLEQFDKRMLSKMNFSKKSASKRTSLMDSVKTTSIPRNKIWANNDNTGLSKHFIKDDNHRNNVENNNTHTTQKAGTNKVDMPDSGKKRRIRLNLSSTYSEKEKQSADSETCKNIETNYLKTNVGIKLHSEKEFIDGKVDFIMNKNIYSKRESEGSILAGTDITSTYENACKKKVHDTMHSVSTQRRKKIFAFVDENNELDRRKRKQLRNKLRIYFGDRITGSEGEEEESILDKRFKRRRKKDSVDSCDSGVCVGKTYITISNIETVKGIQKCIPDCTMHEEISVQSVMHDVTEHEMGEITENTTTKQAKDVTSVSKVINKVKSAMCIKDSVEIENEEIVCQPLANIYDRSSVLRNTIISDAERSQVIEQLQINISEAEVKTQQDLKLDTGRENQIELEPATEVEGEVQQELVGVETQPEVKAATEQVEVKQAKEQAEIKEAKVQAEIKEAKEVQAEIKEAKEVQAEIKEAKAQPEVEGINVQPGVGVNAQPGVERAKPEEIVVVESQPLVEGEVEAQPAEIGVEAQTRGSIAGEVADIDTSCETLRIYSSDIDTDEDLCQFQESNLDTKIFNELLHMSFNDTCRITSNGNVLSIEETGGEEKRQKVMNKEIDENGNLKILPKMQPSYNHGIQEDIPSNTQDNNNIIAKDIQLTIDANQNIRDVSINDVYNIPCSVNEPIIQDSEVNSVTEYENSQPSTVSQCRLRVLSSAELGSRWCPTPANTSTSTVTQTNTVTTLKVPSKHTTPVVVSSVELETQKVPVTIAAPISTSVSTHNMGLQVAESVYVIFVKISNLIQSVRISSPITKLDYNKLLLTEFEKLKKVLNTENYVALTEGVLCVLNRELVLSPPLSLSELFRYTPLVKSLYVRIAQNFKVSVNNANVHQNVSPSVIISNQMPSGQNIYCNQEPLQNIAPVSVQARLRNLLAVSSTEDQTANVISKQLHQNSQEKTALQPQSNILQSNIGMSSIVDNNHNPQQTNYKTLVQRAFTQQKIPNGYLVKHKPITNMYATQGFTTQYSAYSPTGIDPLGRRHISASVLNAPCINQQYSPQRVVVPQVNAFYNVNPPSYLVQQNTSSTHTNVPNLSLPSLSQQYRSIIPRQSVFNMPQGIPVQSVPNVALNYIPQPVQAMFTTNIPHSISKTVQQNEKIDQNVLPQEQTKVLQNHVFKQVTSSQHVQNTNSAKIRWPVSYTKKIANMSVSLESTTKLFDVLKYLTNEQKLILLKHMNFYFSCTMWLEQQFTSDQWRKIHSQRSVLLHFQTLLKHLVEKTVKDLQKQSQVNAVATNILPNITTDVPKTTEVVVRENDGIYYQVDVSKSDQGKTQNTCRNSMTGEGNKNVTVEKQSEKHKEMDNLQNKARFRQSQELLLPNEQEVEKDKLTKETTLLQNDNLVGMPVSETETILNITDQSLDRAEKIVVNVAEVVNDKPLVVSDLKLSNEGILQQSNSQLMTIEISSNRDYVTVVDTNGVSENESINQNAKKCDETQEQELNTSNQLPDFDNTVCKKSLIALVKISDDTKHLNNADSNNSSLRELTISQIADVRSISLEAFEKIEGTEKVSSNTIEINIEEEEIKVCLFCGKSSTVACSICLEAKYCSKTCFLLHWEEHYRDCAPVKSIYS